MFYRQCYGYYWFQQKGNTIITFPYLYRFHRSKPKNHQTLIEMNNTEDSYISINLIMELKLADYYIFSLRTLK